MALLGFKFLERLGARLQTSSAIQAGDRVDEALYKLQNQVDRVAPPPETPTLSYLNGSLARVDYADGSYKSLTYSEGKLVQVDFVREGVTLRKTLSYDTLGNLSSVAQSIL